MLGQIERGESNPTVATLWKIATGFHVSLSSFIEPAAANDHETLVRASQAQGNILADDSEGISPLFAYSEHFGFEIFELSLLPHSERLSEAHDPGVSEHIMLIEGEMEVFTDGKWVAVPKAGAIRFAADQTHGYRNNSNEITRFYTLIHYS